MVNAYGIKNIYIHKMKMSAPSARKGGRIESHCGEWLDEAVDTTATKSPRNATQPDNFAPPADLEAQMAKNEGRGGPGEGIDSVMGNAFADDPKPENQLSPGELGWKGFKHDSPIGQLRAEQLKLHPQDAR